MQSQGPRETGPQFQVSWQEMPVLVILCQRKRAGFVLLCLANIHLPNILVVHACCSLGLSLTPFSRLRNIPLGGCVHLCTH